LIEDPLEITATVQDMKNEHVAPLDAVNDDIGCGGPDTDAWKA